MCGARKSHQQDLGATPAPVVGRARERAVAFGDDRLRASDVERDAAATELRIHAAAGRLDVDELDERISAVLTARTRADIGGALADLPETPPAIDPANAHESHGLNAYLAVMVLLVGIWLLSGGGHFWPLYPALGWGLPLLMGRRSEQAAPGALTHASGPGPR